MNKSVFIVEERGGEYDINHYICENRGRAEILAESLNEENEYVKDGDCYVYVREYFLD